MRIIYLGFILLTCTICQAHGENVYGPNGGFVRMPGAFHTELVPVSKTQLKVFLLDIGWKNPTVKKSKIKVSLLSKANSQADCKITSNYFLCTFPNTVDLTAKGTLKVLAVRDRQKGMEVLYNLPLHLEGGTEIKK